MLSRLLSILLSLLATMATRSAPAQEILLDLRLTLDKDFNFVIEPKFGTGQPPKQWGVISDPGIGSARVVYSGSLLLHPKNHYAIEFPFNGRDDQPLPARPADDEGAEGSEESGRSERPCNRLVE